MDHRPGWLEHRPLKIELDKMFDSAHGRIAWGRGGSGAPIVMVHGTPFSSFVWQRLASTLAETHEVILLDLLGYGLSDKPLRVSLDIQGEVLAEFLGTVCPAKPPVVVAHDYGGTASLRAHLLHGVEYDRLILMDPVAITPWGTPFARHMMRWSEAFETMPDAYHRAVFEAYIASACETRLDPGITAALMQPWLGAEGQSAFYRQIGQADVRYTEEFRDRLGDVRCQSFLLWGENDSWLSVENGRNLASILRPQRFEIAPAAGHLVQFDAPEQVLAFIRSALAHAIDR
ncbi:alpha/beta fold hydrolase [Rhodothalassium salexigens]|uniref:alpha/beta fold hydrolase n=1 Tax=Rhodothalassium salexigens TaxID=1086 RepID=UPI0019141293|nr:alpha/beta hydrolase [Rhodothalassium salexigens]MBK5920579.1 hypothetical protein [Rhodothalassium salexigens]